MLESMLMSLAPGDLCTEYEVSQALVMLLQTARQAARNVC
jgi:hypothetical protein